MARSLSRLEFDTAVGFPADEDVLADPLDKTARAWRAFAKFPVVIRDFAASV